MDSGLYAAYTGVLSRTQALDSVANNLANANTNGFRAQREFFRGVMAGAMESDEQVGAIDQAVNSYGILGGSTSDLAQGELTATGNPLDLALRGQGFFGIQTATGTRYTRDGSFLRASDGTLTTQQGEPVLDTNGKKIQLPTGDVHLAADGTISVSTPDGNAIVATLGRFQFEASQLIPEGTNRFSVIQGATPQASSAQVQQGAIEGANQDAAHGTMQLLLVQRQAEMMQKMLNIFANDFDKTAAEEIGKV